MSCPTCGQMMQGIGDVPAVGGNPVFWCPRCGTIETPASGPAAVPKLVERCREFENRAAFYPSQWHELGIAEAIRVPEDRPPPAA